MLRKYEDKKNHFREIFNTKNGFYARTGILDKNGKDTGIDPFMRDFPALIDVGIMGSCIHGKTGLCMKSGVQCYQNGLKTQKPNMTLEQFEDIAKQCKGKTFQFALGGRGDVNKYENFEDLLKICKKYNIIPNYTTSGLDLTDKEVELTKEYCGATAVSFYNDNPDGYTYKAINKFISLGVTTNIHYVLGNNSIDRAIDNLKNDKFPKGINAIIFLLHKPVGLGKMDNVLQYNDPKVKEFYELIDKGSFNFNIGFDSCSVSGLVNLTKNINKISIMPCESATESCYIDSQLNMMPCSFDNDKLQWAANLKDYTIQEVWDSDVFNKFRNHHKIGCKCSCGKCDKLNVVCRPCPIVPEITLCNK